MICRGRLARLLQEQADGQWPLALRQQPASPQTLPFVGRQVVLKAIGKQVSITALAWACFLLLLLVVSWLGSAWTGEPRLWRNHIRRAREGRVDPHDAD